MLLPAVIVVLPVDDRLVPAIEMLLVAVRFVFPFELCRLPF